MPSVNQLIVLSVLGLGSVLADFLLAKATVLTTPLIVSVGLSLSAPASVIIDVWFKGEVRRVMYYLGILCIILGYLLVNLLAARQVGYKLTFTRVQE